MIVWLGENWHYVVMVAFVIALITTSCFAVYGFIKMPRELQIECVREWLKWAVAKAEKELGAGTGQLKLRFVYDMAVTKFPWLPKMVSFDVFSEWVDLSLEWLDTQLETNSKIKSIIEDKDKE